MLGDRAHRVDTAAVLLREGTGLLRDQSVRLARRIFSRFAFLEFFAAQNLAKTERSRAKNCQSFAGDPGLVCGASGGNRAGPRPEFLILFVAARPRGRNALAQLYSCCPLDRVTPAMPARLTCRVGRRAS